MTASEKIVERIMLEAKAEAEKIITDGSTKADGIKAEAKKAAETQEKALKAVIDKKAEAAAESAESAAGLSVRNAILLRKREEIDKTLDALLKYFLSLDAKEYFDVLYTLAEARVKPTDGVMYLNGTDLARVPNDFKAKVNKLSITVSDEPCDSISGGFILKYNDIEENADLKAIIAEKKETLTDIISKELF